MRKNQPRVSCPTCDPAAWLRSLLLLLLTGCRPSGTPGKADNPQDRRSPAVGAVKGDAPVQVAQEKSASVDAPKESAAQPASGESASIQSKEARAGEEASSRPFHGEEPPVPSQSSIRWKLLMKRQTKEIELRNQQRRAYDGATTGSFSTEGIFEDAMAVKVAEEEVDEMVRKYGIKLAPALAGLCSDPDENIALDARWLLRSLGPEAEPMLQEVEKKRSGAK